MNEINSLYKFAMNILIKAIHFMKYICTISNAIKVFFYIFASY